MALVDNLWKLAAAFGAYLLWRLFHSYWRLRHIPGPFWASLSDIPRTLWVLTGHAQVIHRKLHDKYGPLIRIGPNMISVDEPDAIPTIYTTKPGTIKGAFYDTLSIYKPGQGIVPAVFPCRDEEVHKQLKKPIAPMFSVSSAATLETFVDEVLRVMFTQLDQRFVSSDDDFDFGFWLKAFAFDVMGTLTFSRRYGFLETGEDVGGMQANVWAFMVKASFFTQMPWLDTLMNKNRIAAIFRPPGSTTILGFVMARIIERQQENAADDEKGMRTQNGPKDMLARYLEIPKQQPSVPASAPVAWTFSNVIAGSDSSATVLIAAWYNLLRHPEYLQRLRCELLSVPDLTRPFPAWSEIKDLPYLDACVWESIRIHPPFSLHFQRIVPAAGITVSDKYIPAGTDVGMNPYVANRHAVFGKDVEEWNPGRWMGDAKHRKRLQECVMTFGSGRRVCLGQNIALLELKKSIAALVTNYEITLSEKTNWTVENRWFLRNAGLKARISKRE